MAAVLYMFENLKDHPILRDTDVESLINNTSPEHLKKFLINAMKYDSGMKERFIRFVNGENGSINIAEYKSQLKSLIKKYSYHSSFNKL